MARLEVAVTGMSLGKEEEAIIRAKRAYVCTGPETRFEGTRHCVLLVGFA